MRMPSNKMVFENSHFFRFEKNKTKLNKEFTLAVKPNPLILTN